METAELSHDGESQVVRLPEGFRLPGDRVYIKRLGDAAILLPYHDPWGALIGSLDLFSDDFLTNRAQPAQQERTHPFA
jgi:antitoxin VapB